MARTKVIICLLIAALAIAEDAKPPECAEATLLREEVAALRKLADAGNQEMLALSRLLQDPTLVAAKAKSAEARAELQAVEQKKAAKKVEAAKAQ